MRNTTKLCILLKTGIIQRYARQQHRIGYSLVKKYTVRSTKDVEVNLIKSLYVIKRDSVKEGDNLGRKLRQH